MTDTKSEIAAEDLKNVGGGECTPEEWMRVTSELTNAYESLIDFTSYVFSRVSGTPQ